MVKWGTRCVFCFATLLTFVTLGSLPTSADAMQTFAQAEDKWYKTWPESEEDRAMRMYVVQYFQSYFFFFRIVLTVRRLLVIT